MNKNLKRLLIGLTSFIIVLIVAATIITRLAINKETSQSEQVTAVALTKTPIKKIQKTYHLKRDVTSLGLVGTDAKNKKYYFVYLTASKKAYLYDSDEGVSEAAITKFFKQEHQKDTLKSINLGWYKGRPVWEISYRKTNHKLGYVIYNFKDGAEISVIDNL